MKESSEYVLLDFEFSNGKKKLKLVLTYFNEIPKIDIREYYLDDEGVFRHSKKGIQLDSQKAEALRAALEANAEIIDQHLLNSDLEKWADKIKTIESSADFFSHFEFYKTISKGSEEQIIFNNNHPFGRKIISLESKIENNSEAKELMTLIRCLLISYDHTVSQFDKDSKVQVGDFMQDHNQTWSSLIKRLSKY